jgi:hypothetical protein
MTKSINVLGIITILSLCTTLWTVYLYANVHRECTFHHTNVKDDSLTGEDIQMLTGLVTGSLWGYDEMGRVDNGHYYEVVIIDQYMVEVNKITWEDGEWLVIVTKLTNDWQVVRTLGIPLSDMLRYGIAIQDDNWG